MLIKEIILKHNPFNFLSLFIMFSTFSPVKGSNDYFLVILYVIMPTRYM